MSPIELLRQMWYLLVERGHEYDRNGFSDRYWEITDHYEETKAKRRAAINGR